MQTRPLETAWRDAILALLPAAALAGATVRTAGQSAELLPPVIIAEVQSSESRGAGGRLARAELALIVRTQVDDETADVHTARCDGLAALLAPADHPRWNAALMAALNAPASPVTVHGYAVSTVAHETDQDQREWRSTLTLFVGYGSRD